LATVNVYASIGFHAIALERFFSVTYSIKKILYTMWNCHSNDKETQTLSTSKVRHCSSLCYSLLPKSVYL